MSDNNKLVVLCILDGWGIGDGGEYDAIASANTPNWDRIYSTYPSTTLTTFGLSVGLPEGQMGNSEVGHMNIGAGRVVMQFLPRIDQAFKQDEVAVNAALTNLITKLKKTGGACHLMGLMSDGGVHAHQDHIAKLAQILGAHGIKTYIHAFTDGRDVPPQSALGYLDALENDLPETAEIATIAGRYYAMDRDKRWDRVKLAYDAMTHATGEAASTAKEAIQQSYDADVVDEFIKPTVMNGYEGMKDGDAILFANFRSDRAREILQPLLYPEFADFDRGEPINFAAASGMVEYSDELNELMQTLFPPQEIKNNLGEVVEKAGLKQIRMAETEKYPHVTFFFNSGIETPFTDEDRVLAPSPKVATYDLQPEMSAPELTENLLKAIQSDTYNVVIVNYANPDMVGHTGSITAARKACETVDEALGQLESLVREKDGILIVTADHGNADQMWDPETNGPHTAHTLNPVPFVVIGAGEQTLKEGKLADIAPTMLHYLGVEQPDEMTGDVLCQ